MFHYDTSKEQYTEFTPSKLGRGLIELPSCFVKQFYRKYYHNINHKLNDLQL